LSKCINMLFVLTLIGIAFSTKRRTVSGVKIVKDA
jgi:hypothetical protein